MSTLQNVLEWRIFKTKRNLKCLYTQKGMSLKEESGIQDGFCITDVVLSVCF